MARPSRYSPDVRERAIRMVREHGSEHPSQWAAIASIASKLVYGLRKVWRQLRRDGHRVARCTVERLMRDMGPRDAVRGRAWVITTQSETAADRPADLVDRHFAATWPNQLWVADFTNVASHVVRLRLRRIRDRCLCAPDCRLARLGLRTDFVLDALEQAIYDRCGAGATDLVHHSDRRTQYLSMRFTERLTDAGIAPSVGSRGDSYDNALAESIIGLFKTEVVQRKGRGATSRPSNSPRSTGSPGSTRVACSNPLATCRPPSTRRSTMRTLQRVALAGSQISTARSTGRPPSTRRTFFDHRRTRECKQN